MLSHSDACREHIACRADIRRGFNLFAAGTTGRQTYTEQYLRQYDGFGILSLLLQVEDLKTNTNISNVLPHKVVGRVSGTQLQVGEHMNKIFLTAK